MKPGKNVIAIRLFRSHGGKSFISPADRLRLTIGDQAFPLDSEWKGIVAVDGRPPQKMPLGYENLVSMPGVLYHGMLEPILPLAITGALWYQGESNAERGQQYRKILPALIKGWRQAFGQGEFPFYIVSLPAYQHRRETPGTDSWAEAREAQALTVRSVPHTCLAVTVDTGDADNVHPIDKKEVGERLAYCALAEHYSFKIPASGPTLSSVEKMPGALKLHFDHADGGLVVMGEKLGEFAVAGDDGKWHWAEGRIEGKRSSYRPVRFRIPR